MHFLFLCLAFSRSVYFPSLLTRLLAGVFAAASLSTLALASQAGINNSGWTVKEIQAAMTKSYGVDLIGVSRFLYSSDGVAFLEDQTKSYSPFWKKQKTAVVALRSAIILDATDGEISAAGIMKQLPVAFRLNDNGVSDGSQNVCKYGFNGAQATSLRSWYVFLPACVQAKQILPAATAPSATRNASDRGLW